MAIPYRLFTLFSLSVLGLHSNSFAGDFSGNVSIEGRYFLNEPLHKGQAEHSYSISFQPEYRKRWDKGRKKFTFVPFYRWDSEDSERRHGDIRELDIVIANDQWEFQAGIGKVFWGVAESQHLVDIINQTDAIESSDGEDKLGQPMIRLSHLLKNGSIDAYLLPYFRERTFVGKAGRLRSAIPVDTDQATYESDDEEQHLDYAIRWNQSIDNVDFGVHWFEGTSRDPELIPQQRANGNHTETVLVPHYSLIRQAGLDLQYTGDAWLWKLESIHRDTNKGSYRAAVGGFEYTLTGVADSAADLGLLAEYHYDSRDQQATTPFQNDLFLGTRLALNDTQSSVLLAGAFIDLDDQARSFRLEASRRIGDSSKLNLEAQLISHTSENESFHDLRDDDYIQLEWQQYF